MNPFIDLANWIDLVGSTAYSQNPKKDNTLKYA